MLEGVRCVLPCMLEVVEYGFCLPEVLEALEVPVVMGCVLLSMLEVSKMMCCVLLCMLDAVGLVCWTCWRRCTACRSVCEGC